MVDGSGLRVGGVEMRVGGVHVEAVVPAGMVPSSRTLGEDLRRRLMTRLYGEVHSSGELLRRAKSAAAEVVRTFFVADELARVSVDATVEPAPLNAREAIVTARIEVRA